MKFYGELLVFLLLFLTNFRVFFVHHVKRDPLVMLAPFTFIIAILQIFAWGVDFFTTLGLLIAIFVLLSNFHAIFRYIEALYVDHYSLLMKSWAVVTILLSVAAIAGTIIFAPIEKKNIDLKITEEQILYKGSFRSGFEKAGPFEKKNLILTKFYPGTFIPDEPAGQDPQVIILLIPDKRADTAHYVPYLQELAARGITVYSADFYTDDGKWLHSIGDSKILRRLVLAVHSVLNNQWFMGQREYYTFNISQEISALLPLMEEYTGNECKFFFITDVMSDVAASDIQKKMTGKIYGSFALDSVEGYKSAGYGCVEQTDPMLASALGLKRDSSRTTPKLLADKTMEVLNDTK